MDTTTPVEQAAPLVETKKERTRRLQREWAARNPDKMRAKWQRRYQKDPEKQKQRYRKYKEDNKEKIAAKKKAARSTPEAKAKEKIRRKAYYEANKSREAAKMAEWYRANRDSQLMYAKEYASRPEVIPRVKERSAEYRKKNADRIKAWSKAWAAANKQYLKERQKQRIAKDPDFWKKHWLWAKGRPATRMALACRSRVRDLVLRAKMPKRRPHIISALVGCSGEQLAAHLESLFVDGMTWQNYGKNGWHIDHKRPCASFDLTDPEQQKQCFHYTNLQPLWWWDNIAKSDKYEPEVVANTG